MRLSLPGLALAEQLYVSLQAHGHGRSGTQALILALASMSKVEKTPSGQPASLAKRRWTRTPRRRPPGRTR